MDETVAAVLATERAWTEAHLRGGVAPSARLMTGDFAKIQPEGLVIGRAEAPATFVPEDGSTFGVTAHSRWWLSSRQIYSIPRASGTRGSALPLLGPAPDPT